MFSTLAMAFYYIDTARHAQRIEIFRRACEKRGVEFKLIDPGSFDFGHVPNLRRSDFLYTRVLDRENPLTSYVEKSLLNKQVTTFYESYRVASTLIGRPTYLAYVQEGALIPRTIPWFGKDLQQLRKQVEYLGGFPIVVKIPGFSRGKGVLRMSSWQELVVQMEQFFEEGQEVLLREFIDAGVPVHVHRAIVLGDDVVFAFSVKRTDTHDFRTNVAGSVVERERLKLSDAEKQNLVKAVHALGIEIGAVDFVKRSSDGSLVIFEVNFPFNFASPLVYFNYDLPGEMIGYLQRKSLGQHSG